MAKEAGVVMAGDLTTIGGLPLLTLPSCGWSPMAISSMPLFEANCS
jgi:hypothetical protein